jgi:serine/threonine-protein kinase
MAPEQITGSQPVDARTDIYAIGCVVYWLLTGRQVFEGPTVWSVILQHLQQQPIPPSIRTGLSVPPEVERVVLACLEKQPADRPQSVELLRGMLSNCGASSVWTQESAIVWWREHAPPRDVGTPGDVQVMMPTFVPRL